MKTHRTIIAVKMDRCNGCGACVDVCVNYGFHVTAIQLVDGKCQLVQEGLCQGRGDCMAVCTEKALFLEQRPADLIRKPMNVGF